MSLLLNKPFWVLKHPVLQMHRPENKTKFIEEEDYIDKSKQSFERSLSGSSVGFPTGQLWPSGRNDGTDNVNKFMINLDG